MRNKDVASVLPNTSTKFSVPMVTYSLSPPLAGKLFNFNQFVNSLDMDEFLSNPNILPCNCKNSPFIDKYHKHIITGDLRIISNSNLRKLFSKGPKYREPKSINLNKAKECILDGLAQCIDNWCNKYGINKVLFSEWININSKLMIELMN